MADRKISDLTALTTPASGDYLPIVDISEIAASSKNKRITIEELFRGVPAGTAAAPSIAIEGDEDTGIYSPGANQLAVATNGAQRLTVDTAATTSTLPVVHPLGAVGTPSITFTGDLNTGFYSPGADTLAAVTAGANRLHITSAGLVGIGTSVPRGNFEISTPISYGGSANQSIYIGASNVGNGVNNDRTLAWKFHVAGDQNGQNLTLYSVDDVGATNGENPRVTFTRTGVGIGTTSPAYKLDVTGGGVGVNTSAGTAASVVFNQSGIGVAEVGMPASENALTFKTWTGAALQERFRCDSSGRLLVGTSTYDGNARVVVQGNTSSNTTGALVVRYNGTRPLSAGEGIGSIRFESTSQTSSNYHYASISCDTDGASGSDTDIPGRLVFSVTADGAASPTEALRISSNRAITVSDGGNVVLGTTTGTKIGTATTQKLGFYNATPVVQPAAVADATDAATVITQLNDLLAKLRTLGIIAT